MAKFGSETANNTADAPKEKKARKPIVRKPVEIAVVARAIGGDGVVIQGATVDIVMASKDISAAFAAFKQNPGADMVTFKMGNEKSPAVEVEKQAA